MARAALGSWLLPLLFALFATFSAVPAQAQAPVQTVVVLDFAVADGLDPLLGRKAADGLAVELQRSGDFEVVTRQRVDEAVGQQAGLQPPYNDTAQIRLAQAVGARSVFSGRVASVDITPGRAARVRLEVRQLDATTGDYINGTQVSEPTEQKLQNVANEILVDEAINKSVFSAARTMKQSNLPEGSVLNTTTNDVEVSIGSRNGVVVGQRYTILRDIYNRAKQITERVKIGELKIVQVQSDQATGVLSAGGAAGIRTGDHIREIFVPSNFPTASLNSTNGTTPVTAPPVRAAGGNQFIKKGGNTALGLLALAGLVGLAGFGGGTSNSSSVAPQVQNPFVTNASADLPYATVPFTSGFTGIAKGFLGESVVGYLIFRGTTPDFSADITTLQAFIDAREASSPTQTIRYSDVNNIAVSQFLNVTISATDISAGTVSVSGPSSVPGGVLSKAESSTTISFTYFPRPLVIGQTYYYRVGRITADRIRSNGGGGTTTTGTTTTGTTTTGTTTTGTTTTGTTTTGTTTTGTTTTGTTTTGTTTTGTTTTGTTTTGTTTTGTGGTTTSISLRPILSRVSSPSGGYTPLFRPVIQRDPTQYNIDDLSIRINFDVTPFAGSTAFTLPFGANVGSGVNQFRVQVSTATTFSESTTFTSPDLLNPGAATGASIVFNRNNGLGDIFLPNLSKTYVENQTPIYARVLSRNTEDAVPTFRIGPTLVLGPTLGKDSVSASRFLSASASRLGGGVSLPRPGRGLTGASGGSSPPRVLRPR